MKTVIKIVGVGNRVAGLKNGNPYDFTPIAFTYSDGRISGERAETVNVSADCLGSSIPRVGDFHEVVLHQQNYRTYIDAFLD